jgi:signal transduction histidine kinase
VEFVARQVGVDPAELGFYEWTGRTIEYHRAQIRSHLGFRECSVADADKLTEWLVANVCEAERRPELVRDELLVRCRAERIEPPAVGRIDRIVRSALHQAEQRLTARIVGRLPVAVAGRLRTLVAVDVLDDTVDVLDDTGEDSVLALIKSVPGNVSLDSMLTEIRKLRTVRAVGLPAGLFADVAPRVVAVWRARAAVESPSHLRDHPKPLMLTLLAALVHAGDEERRRLERDLHDGAQQRLVSVGMALRLAQRHLDDGTVDMDELIDQAVAELGTAVAELRQIAHGLRPSSLDDGLHAALAALTQHVPIPVGLEVEPEPLPDDVATTVYYVTSEAITNAVKHADASRIDVRIARCNGHLEVRIIDDGRGGATVAAGSGLAGLSDRVHALGGALALHSSYGCGTIVEATVPCGS